jgi:uncharacterized membrane protein YhfC
MPQIYIMAVITLVTSLVLWGGLIYLLTGHQKRYFWLLLLGLPLSAIANFFLKRPAIIFVGQVFHVQPGLGLASPAWFLAFMVLITPLVEEPIKVLPLLLRRVWNMVTSQTTALWVGFALGISYGLGEAALIAYGVGQNGAYASLPWYVFTGFLNERIMACFAHGVFTAVLLTGMQRRGRSLVYGLVGAMGLHLFLNMPAVMYQFKWISNGLYSILILIPLVVLAVIFERLRRAARQPKDDQSDNEVIYWQRQVQ